MILSKLQTQTKRYAQLAGVLYLIIAIIGGFSIGYVPSQIVVEGNTNLTFQNLLTHQELFRWAIAGDIFVMIFEIILTVMLYQLFKSVSKTGITIATYSRFAMAIIMGMNLINYMIPAIIINHPEYFTSMTAEQLESLNYLFLKAHKYGELAWQLFFAIHLFMLGYVIQKSGLFSKWLGVLMLIGGIAYGGDSFIQMTFIQSNFLSILFSSLLVLAVIGEFWFAFWLLIKKIKKDELD